MFKKNGSTTGIQVASTSITTIPMIFGNHEVLWFYFLIDLELVVLDFQQTQFSENPMMKAWEYGMVAYFLKIPNPQKTHSSIV